jgi:hypothetical protein
MLNLERQSQVDKAKEILREVVSYADEVVRDERLRADIQAAVGHGSRAGDRVQRDIDAGGITTRLAADKKLRKNLRALLDDLDSASERMRRKKGHRVRNALLIAGSAGAVLAAVPNARRWLASRRSESANGAIHGDVNTFTRDGERDAIAVT